MLWITKVRIDYSLVLDCWDFGLVWDDRRPIHCQLSSWYSNDLSWAERGKEIWRGGEKDGRFDRADKNHIEWVRRRLQPRSELNISEIMQEIITFGILTRVSFEEVVQKNRELFLQYCYASCMQNKYFIALALNLLLLNTCNLLVDGYKH